MKKFTGRYTTNTAKALKGSERILCQVSEDGTIYICNGFLLCTMNAPETDPHFYMAKAHLFHALQVEKSKR